MPIFESGAVARMAHVEILQCWLPSREPSFIDVATNSISTVLGVLMYFVAGDRDFSRINRFLV